MRKGNRTLLTSVFAIAIVAMGVGAGTLAYFSSAPVAAGNTFTAGDLDVRLSATETGGYSTGPLSGFWTADDWAPGETHTRKLYFKNFGSVDAKVLLLNFENYAGTPANFWDVIEINVFKEYDSGEFNFATMVAEWDAPPNYGDGAVPLTLHELIIGVPDSTPGHLDAYDFILYNTFRADTDADGHNEFGGAYLAAGATGWIELGFKFSEDAENEYQGATLTFDLELMFLQGPEWLDKDEMPGYVSP